MYAVLYFNVNDCLGKVSDTRIMGIKTRVE